MRILHVVTNADLGGAPRVVTELAKRAVAAGHVCGAASMPQGPFWEQLDERVERLPLFQLRREIDPLHDLAAYFELRRLFRTWRPDIIHLHSSKAGVLGRLAAGRLSGRVVYTIHGFDTILKSHRIFLPLERLLSGRCGAIVPVSDYDKRNLAASGIVGRIELIRNGASDRLTTEPKKAEAAERLRAAKASGALVVLSIARLAPPKRFDLFLETARAFSSAAGRFFWIGNREAVDPGGLPANVEVLGELAEAGDYIKLADVFLLLSDYEGLPMSIIEALSSGRPVVASRVGGIGELVDAGCGRLVENEAPAVIDAIRGMLRDGPWREELGKAARRKYDDEAGAEAMARRYQDLYAKLVTLSPRA